MSNLNPRCSLHFLLLLACVIAGTIGCEKESELAIVRGTITDDGEPLDEVKVKFLPDPDKGGEGEASTAYTDAAGRYELAYGRKADKPGAVVGWHRVAIQDAKSENFRGGGRPPEIRVPIPMRTSSDTPLQFEVVPGEQTIDFDISIPSSK